MTINEESVKTLKNIKVLKFEKTKEFGTFAKDSDELATANITLDISKVDTLMKAYLTQYFYHKFVKPNYSRVRVKNIDFEKWIVEYQGLHGFGYNWGEDLYEDFQEYLDDEHMIKEEDKELLRKATIDIK